MYPVYESSCNICFLQHFADHDICNILLNTVSSFFDALLKVSTQ